MNKVTLSPIINRKVQLDLEDIDLDEPPTPHLNFTAEDEAAHINRLDKFLDALPSLPGKRAICVFLGVATTMSTIMVIAITLPPLILRQNVHKPEIAHREHVVQFDTPSFTNGFAEEGLLVCGSSLMDDTTDAADFPLSSCLDVLIPDRQTTKGHWYGFLGTGSCVTLSTCHAETEFDTSLRVYTGGLGIMGGHKCIAANDDANQSCNAGDDLSVTSFKTEAHTFYSVFVGGFGSQVGQYRLSMECTTDCSDSFI